MLRLIFAFLCAAAACMLVAGALTSAQSTSNSTPDAFLAQVTHGTTLRDSSAIDISANGRFVVFESIADASTLKPGQTLATKSPNNTDGNREVFLYDYAQRRIFQLTNTRSVLKPAGSPSPSPSPSPSVSPSASPTPTPIDLTNVAIEISNNRPMISAEPALSSGSRTYTIVFSSNAPVTPANFDGTDPGAPTNTDMNQELWTYQFTVPDTVNLSAGADIAFQDLSTGTFSRITNTPASAPPTAGAAAKAPSVADDNRDAAISDDGQVIVFSSTRDLVAGGNTDTGAIPNPEVFLYNRGTGIFTQATNTKTTNNAFAVFNDYPCIAGSGGVYTIAFYSNADLTPAASPGNPDLNAEVFMASYNGATVSGLKQVTKTKDATDSNGRSLRPTNNFIFGRRLSRDGRYIALESLVNDPKANATSNAAGFSVTFVYDALSDSFSQVGPRALATPGDVSHYPTFTDYTGTSPATIVFTSALNFKSDGTFPASDQDATGLNSGRVSQIFATALPAQATGPFVRLTNIVGTNVLAPVNSLPSNSRSRIAFTMGGAELGGGNADLSGEVFYNLSPTVTTESTATISLFTGASLIPVAAASPIPSGSPTPSPSASPGIAPGLAAGELSVINSTASLAPSSASTANASESSFAPPLPVELNGVSVSIRGAAAGIYSVSSSAISFVVPKGLPTGVYPVVISIQDTSTNPVSFRMVRGFVAVIAAQPDIFTSTMGAGGRAFVFDVTNPSVEMAEPFTITSTTTLRVVLTGVQGVTSSQVSIRIGTTDITGAAILTGAVPRDPPGFYQIDFTPPTSLAGAGDVPVIVTVTVNGVAFTSRPASSAPLIHIN